MDRVTDRDDRACGLLDDPIHPLSSRQSCQQVLECRLGHAYSLFARDGENVPLGWIARIAALQIRNDGHLPINIDSCHIDAPYVDTLVVCGQTWSVDIHGEYLGLAIEVLSWYAHWPYWDERARIVAAAGKVRRFICWRTRFDSRVLEDGPTSTVAESGASGLYVCPEPVILCGLVGMDDHVVSLT